MVHPLPPFKWPKTVAEIEEATAAVLKAAEENLNKVAAEETLSFKAIISPLMAPPHYKVNPLVCQAKFLQHVSTDAAVREAATAAGQKFASCKAAAKTRDDVYAKVEAFSKTDEAKALGEYETHFLQAVLKDFRRGGLSLSADDRKKLQELLDADAACCNSYKTNLAEDTTKVTFKPADLEGCPEDFVKERTDGGVVTLTLKYPDILPVLSNCVVSSTRKKLTEARETAYGNNLDHVATGIQLRKQTAQLLGYESWAHFVTEQRMTGSPDVVTEFMESLHKQALPGAEADVAELKAKKSAFLKARSEENDGELHPWDGSFYHDMIIKEEYGVDNEKIKEYFPLDHVVATTLEIYQELLGLTFTELSDFDRWHDSVRLFIVHDSQEGYRVGHFYLDLFPRDGKYNHAAIFHLLKRHGEQTAVDCMVCNLPAPSPDGTPSRLRHDDVVTFFHEFGHIMHGLCSEGEANSTRLAKCPRDFVEAPSQMLENWCWQPKTLARLSKHCKTGESLPDELLASMVRAKNVHEGFFMLRQLYLGSLDMAIHGLTPPEGADGLQALVDEMRPRLSLVRNPPGANMLRSFGHLMNQYSASYYGYLWAEVLSADMFKTKFEADCMSKESGMAYRKQVLAPGGVGKIMDHLSSFLERKPDQRAFLQSRGILKVVDPEDRKASTKGGYA